MHLFTEYCINVTKNRQFFETWRITIMISHSCTKMRIKTHSWQATEKQVWNKNQERVKVSIVTLMYHTHLYRSLFFQLLIFPFDLEATMENFITSSQTVGVYLEPPCQSQAAGPTPAAWRHCPSRLGTSCCSQSTARASRHCPGPRFGEYLALPTFLAELSLWCCSSSFP